MRIPRKAVFKDAPFTSAPVSGGFVIRVGGQVLVQGQPGIVVAVLDLGEALIRDKGTGVTSKVPIDKIQSPERLAPDTNHRPAEDLLNVSTPEWDEAMRRYRIIQPLLAPGRKKGEADRLASEFGIHRATIYEWKRLYQKGGGRISALIPPRPPGGKGGTRLEAQVEEIVNNALRTLYLTDQRRKLSKVWEDIVMRCKEHNLPPPTYNTLRRRVAALSGHEKVKQRVGAKEAYEAKHIHRGHFDDSDFPLVQVQIDHTPLDIILVDEVTRQPVGKPWLTLAIDVYTRMVVGYYVTYDPPGALSVGLCLVHAILPKEPWLAQFDIKTSWPCWGVPQTVRADNGKDFRSQTIQRSCEEHGINVEWRPVGRPNFGGHIERLLGTFLREVHTLPGTTFSSIAERGNYPSMQKSAFTLREFEVWLATYITGVYHQRPHSALDGQCPLKRYEEGILGTPTRAGRGLPVKVTDEQRLLLDFLPGVERNIQEFGIQIDKINYFSDELRPHVLVPDPDRPGQKRKFLFRRDPRDISVIYFFDPDSRLYWPIPYRNPAYPPISVWELREARRILREHHQGQIDEDTIFQAVQRMRGIQDAAVATTTKTRRTAVRRRIHQETSIHPKPPAPPEAPGPSQALPRANPGWIPDPWAEAVQPFEAELSAFDQLFRSGKPIIPFDVEK